MPRDATQRSRPRLSRGDRARSVPAGVAARDGRFQGRRARERRAASRALHRQVGESMSIVLTEEQRMLKDLVAKFVRDEMMPLENKVLARDAEGKGMGFTEEEQQRLDARSKE